MENIPKLRFAHPTDNLERSIFFYRDGLGFEILDRYTEQQGWDGVIFGHRDWPYQIEISQKRGTDPVPRNATVNHFLVFRSLRPSTGSGVLRPSLMRALPRFRFRNSITTGLRPATRTPTATALY